MFTSPTHIFPISDGTPALLNTVEEKQNTAFMPDSCCNANRTAPTNTTTETEKTEYTQ